MIKAIETEYAGHRFRSRLEARWAVFFNELGINWRYEHEGYVIDGRRYLPDFELPDLGAFVEVKGDEGEIHDKYDTYSSLARESSRHVIFLGDVPEVPGRNSSYALAHTAILAGIGSLHSVVFGSYEGRSELIPLHVCRAANLLEPMVVGLSPSPGVNEAYQTARKARFEHGEAPGR